MTPVPLRTPWSADRDGAAQPIHFTVALPVTEFLGRESPPADLPNLPVLIIDDNAVNRRILVDQVRRFGMTPTAIDNGRDGLRALEGAALKGAPFGLVLLDAQMPECDGFAVAAEIQARSALARPTVLMLSSSGKYGDYTRCNDLGIAVYLTKPVNADDLRAAIARALEPRPAETAPANDPAPVSPRASVARRRILLVEDNVVNQRVAMGLLARRGHDVTLAENGLEALDALARNGYDIVLMDLQMPEMGGLEATAAVRERERTTGEHTWIAAMTAHAMSGDRERCLQGGMDDYISKPITPELLFAAVEQPVLAGRPVAADAPAVLEVFDDVALRARVQGDEVLLYEIIGMFLADCPARVAAIAEAAAQVDAPALRLAAHALRGAAGNLGAARLVEAACAAERIGADARMSEAAGAASRVASEAAEALAAMRRFAAGGVDVEPACAP